MKTRYDFHNIDPQERQSPSDEFQSELGDALEIALLDNNIQKVISSGIKTREEVIGFLYDIMQEVIESNPDDWYYEDESEDGYYIEFYADRLAEYAVNAFLDSIGYINGESYMKEEVNIKITKGSATAKVRKLQKQYNKILVDLFDQFAAESIEEALERNEGSFGENINDIVQSALDNLKTKVLGELGVKGDTVGEIGIAIGGGDISELMGGAAEETSEGEEDETAEHEDGESDKWEAGEQAAGDTDKEKDEDDDKDEDKDGPLGEKAPSGAKMERMVKHIKKSEKAAGKSDEESKKIAYATAWKKRNESDESLKRERVISESRRNDQTSIMDAYMSMLKKGK